MSDSSRDLVSQRASQAKSIVNNHIVWAMGAGVIPVPVVDIAAVAAIQIDMLKKLSSLYQVNFDEERGKSWLSILSAGFASRVAANALKLVPGVGSVIGGGAMAITSGASTYALGTVVSGHFARNGTFEDLDLDAAKKEFDAAYSEGKKVAKDLKTQGQDTPPPADDAADPLERLERLAALKERGVLTDEEFAAAKAKILAD